MSSNHDSLGAVEGTDETNGDKHGKEEETDPITLADSHDLDHQLDITVPQHHPFRHDSLGLVYVDHNLDNHANIGRPETARELKIVICDHGVDAPFNASNFVVPSQPATGVFCLPLEVRLMIWRLLLPGRRIFEAKCRFGFPRNAHHHERGVRYWHLGFRQPVSQPVLTQICRESRALALTHGAIIF